MCLWLIITREVNNVGWTHSSPFALRQHESAQNDAAKYRQGGRRVPLAPAERDSLKIQKSSCPTHTEYTHLCTISLLNTCRKKTGSISNQTDVVARTFQLRFRETSVLQTHPPISSVIWTTHTSCLLKPQIIITQLQVKIKHNSASELGPR